MPSTSIKLIPLWSLCFEQIASCWKDNGSELSTSLTINRRMFTSAKLQDDVQGGVTISTVVVVLALAHTHTPTHGAVIWHNHSHGADKDGDGIHSSPHGWWQSLLQQMWLNPTKAIPSAGRCHLLWQCLSNYISFGWGVGVMCWTSYKWDEPSNKGLCNPKCVTVHYLNVRKFKLCEDC